MDNPFSSDFVMMVTEDATTHELVALAIGYGFGTPMVAICRRGCPTYCVDDIFLSQVADNWGDLAARHPFAGAGLLTDIGLCISFGPTPAGPAVALRPANPALALPGAPVCLSRDAWAALAAACADLPGPLKNSRCRARSRRRHGRRAA